MWAKFFANNVPGETSVHKYWDKEEKYSIDILTSKSKEGIVAATIGLMDIDISNNETDIINTEIIMDSRGNNDYIGNIISTIGFYIIKDNYKIKPGTVIDNIIIQIPLGLCTLGFQQPLVDRLQDQFLLLRKRNNA